MRHRSILSPRFRMVVVLSVMIFLCASTASVDAADRSGHAAFQRKIIDYRSRLNPRFKKVARKHTKYIIVHTSEGGLQSTLRTVSKGKRVSRRYRTAGGHAHYVISRNGGTYRILDKRYVADHAGRSMWNGETDISRLSIGIELVGYHYTPITEQQYRSVETLIDILQQVYRLDDRAVLTHSQVAYGKPNRWIGKNHRGRKRCANNFDRRKAGLGSTWDHDPDVRAGRLAPDPKLAKLFYSPGVTVATAENTNVISKTNTAWSIAGEDFDSPSTVYKLPDGRVLGGDQVETAMGWNRVPPKTVVLLNQQPPSETRMEEGPIKTILEDVTAWSHAGQAYNSRSTFYFLPTGRVRDGSRILDWDDLPSMTRMIVGYRGPFELGRTSTAYRIAGQRYRDEDTIYYLPTRELYPGNRIADFTRLPSGTLVFLPSL